MKIVIDARMYSQSGIGRYLRNLIEQLKEIDTQNDYTILMLPEDFHLLQSTRNFTKFPVHFRWYGVKEQLELPKILKELNPDLVHFPHFNVPVLYKGNYVVTIHDLIHQHFSMQRASTHGQLMYKIKQFGYNRVFSTALKNSKNILTVSDFVKKQLMQEWKVPESKVTLTYEGVEENILKLNQQITPQQTKEILTKFKIKQPFIFYIGNVHPHKNVEGLIEAFMKLRKDSQPLQLVLGGKNNYFWGRLKSWVDSRFGKNDGVGDIIFTDFVSDEEMVILYKSAQLYVQPSFEEGFGIPILEAMACECPVVSSNAASLPEVGGEACMYFDPKDTVDCAEKIKQVLSNEKLRKELIEKGIEQYKKFSWKKMAEETLQIYNAE